MVSETPESKNDLEKVIETLESEVESLSEAEEQAGDRVLAYVAGRLVQVSESKVRASKAKYRLEVWLLPPVPNRIWRPVRTFLWVAGETTGPGGDTIIRECSTPGCTGIFLPGSPSIIKNRQPHYFCEKCKRWMPRSKLNDSRICVGTWDVLGAHLAFRYAQLNHDATILKRILHEDPYDHVGDVIDGQRGATDRYVRAQSRRDVVYYLWEDIVRATTGCVDLGKHFQAFLKA